MGNNHSTNNSNNKTINIDKTITALNTETKTEDLNTKALNKIINQNKNFTSKDQKKLKFLSEKDFYQISQEYQSELARRAIKKDKYLKDFPFSEDLAYYSNHNGEGVHNKSTKLSRVSE